MPRLLAPHMHGLFATAPQTGWTSVELAPGHSGRHESNPTLVNNVETLANAAALMARGSDWYRTMGPAASPGHLPFTVVGDVRPAALDKAAPGTPLPPVTAAAAGGAPDG